MRTTDLGEPLGGTVKTPREILGRPRVGRMTQSPSVFRLQLNLEAKFTICPGKPIKTAKLIDKAEKGDLSSVATLGGEIKSVAKFSNRSRVSGQLYQEQRRQKTFGESCEKVQR